MADFFARYSPSSSAGGTVTANQGTSPWIVAGGQTAGSSGTAVLTVQGIAGGTAVPISGSITATNPSVGATGAAVPASGTYIAASVAGTLTGLAATANGLKVDVAASVLPTGAATETTLAAASAKLPATLGQKTSANSMAVVVASDQSAIPVSGTVAISGTVAATQSGTWNITNVSGTVSLPTGASTEATLAKLAVTQGSTTSGQSGTLTLGAVTTAAPSYTTAQSSPLSLTTAGALRTDASGSTQPVSGTVAATQSGTWNIGTVTTVSAVSAIAPVTTTTAAFQAEGAVAFGSITNSFVTLFTPTAATKILQMRNNMNASVAISMDAGSTTNYILDAGDALSLDLLANALNMGATAIQVKYAVGAPTSGSFRINACH